MLLENNWVVVLSEFHCFLLYEGRKYYKTWSEQPLPITFLIKKTGKHPSLRERGGAGSSCPNQIRVCALASSVTGRLRLPFSEN